MNIGYYTTTLKGNLKQTEAIVELIFLEYKKAKKGKIDRN